MLWSRTRKQPVDLALKHVRAIERWAIDGLLTVKSLGGRLRLPCVNDATDTLRREADASFKALKAA